MSSIITLKVGSLPNSSFLFSNSLFINSQDFKKFQKTANFTNETIFVRVMNFIFKLEQSDLVPEGSVAFGKIKRDQCGLSSNSTVDLEYIPKLTMKEATSIKLQLTLSKKPTGVGYNQAFELSENEIYEFLLSKYPNTLLNEKQYIYMEIHNGVIIGQPVKIYMEDTSVHDAFLTPKTEIECFSSNNTLKIKYNKAKPKKITKEGFDFKSMGVGGLHDEINKIFRTAFASRQHSAETIRKFGTKHVKGVLLYGPPGTGKTLVARTLANILNAEECRVINGPELFDKYVGETEKKIRELFLNAEQDEKKNGDSSGLHVIIFDEIDSICRSRGSISSGTGVHDSAVNQLLTKIDGVESLNNILVIGMTNRKELIDEAILRPGRLELHVEISLPTYEERKEIFEIHTRQMTKNDLLEKDVKLDELAALTKNFTGAEIETLVKRAASFALNSFQIGKETKKQEVTYRKVCKTDFELALEEVQPMFGSDNKSLETPIKYGMMDYGSKYQVIEDKMHSLINQLKNSKSANLMSVLLFGDEGTGKTSIACSTAIKSGFPYVKIISPEMLIGMLEVGKNQEIVKIFENAYKSPLSLVIIDNLERVIEYIKIGPRFSNLLLQTILVYVKKIPPKSENKIMIIGTTSIPNRLNDLELVNVFNYRINIPLLEKPEVKKVLKNYSDKTDVIEKISDLYIGKVAIKNLLMSIDESIQEREGELAYEDFEKAFNNNPRCQFTNDLDF